MSFPFPRHAKRNGGQKRDDLRRGNQHGGQKRDDLRRGNQHGGRKRDDLQNWLVMTSHENPLYAGYIRKIVSIAKWHIS